MKTYDQIHVQLERERGDASDHVCISCSRTAAHWAYQYTGVMLRSPEGSPYSEDVLGDYSPMCRSCHTSLDWTDPVIRQRRMVGAGKIGSWVAGNLLVDQELAERYRTVGVRLGRWVAEQCEAGLVETQRSGGRAVSRLRRRCLSCGLVSSPGPIGVHLKALGHGGYEDVA